MKLERQADLRSSKASQAKVRNLAFNPRVVGSHGKVAKRGGMCSDLHSPWKNRIESSSLGTKEAPY